MFEDYMSERNDQIDNAAYRLLLLMAGADENEVDELIEKDNAPVEWDMELIGEVVTTAEEMLEKNGYAFCHPFYEGDSETPCFKGKDCVNPNCPFRKEAEENG